MAEGNAAIVGAERAVDDLKATLETAVGSLLADHRANLEVAGHALAAQEELVRRIEEQLGGDPAGWAAITVRDKRGMRTDSFPVGCAITIVRQGFAFNVASDGALYVVPTKSREQLVVELFVFVGKGSKRSFSTPREDASVSIVWSDSQEGVEQDLT